MKLEDGLTPFDISMKMKDLGFEQDSIYFWIKWNDSGVNDLMLQTELCDDDKDITKLCSAFISDEIGDKLPERIWSDDEEYSLRMWKNGDRWEILYTYHHDGVWHMLHSERDDKIVIVLAKMWIYLKTNNLI